MYTYFLEYNQKWNGELNKSGSASFSFKPPHLKLLFKSVKTLITVYFKYYDKYIYLDTCLIEIHVLEEISGITVNFP